MRARWTAGILLAISLTLGVVSASADGWLLDTRSNVPVRYVGAFPTTCVAGMGLLGFDPASVGGGWKTCTGGTTGGTFSPIGSGGTPVSLQQAKDSGRDIANADSQATGIRVGKITGNVAVDTYHEFYADATGPVWAQICPGGLPCAAITFAKDLKVDTGKYYWLSGGTAAPAGGDCTASAALRVYIQFTTDALTNEILWVCDGNSWKQLGGAASTDIGVRVTRSTAQSITHDTPTTILFDVEEYDTDTMHSLVSNTDRIVFTTAGKYLITCALYWDGNATGIRAIDLLLGGTTRIAGDVRLNVGAGQELNNQVTVIRAFNAADFVVLSGYQNSTTSLNVRVTDDQDPQCSAQKVN